MYFLLDYQTEPTEASLVAVACGVSCCLEMRTAQERSVGRSTRSGQHDGSLTETDIIGPSRVTAKNDHLVSLRADGFWYTPYAATRIRGTSQRRPGEKGSKYKTAYSGPSAQLPELEELVGAGRSEEGCWTVNGEGGYEGGVGVVDGAEASRLVPIVEVPDLNGAVIAG